MIRINAATDLAQIGIWDPEEEAHELSTAKFSAYENGLQQRAQGGQLFFINTGGDGEFSTDVYLDEEVPEKTLKWMKKIDGLFRLNSSSGKLLVGGLEDFVNESKAVTSARDEIPVPPGGYRLTLYVSELQEESEETEKEIINRVGEHDYKYYTGKGTGLGFGCLCVLIAAALPFFTSWLWSVVPVAIGGSYVILRQKRLGRDARYNKVADAISTFLDEVPTFVVHLQSGADEDLKGGWYDLG